MQRQRYGLAHVMLVVVLALIAAGLALHGFRLFAFERGWQNLLARRSQKLALRFILQPRMAAILMIRVVVAVLLAFIPYLILRGPAARLARRRR